MDDTGSEFGGQLAKLTSKALTTSRGMGLDPEVNAEVVERLLNAAALAIAVAGKGDATVMGQLLAGAETYLNEEAAAKAPLARLLCGRRPSPPKGSSHDG